MIDLVRITGWGLVAASLLGGLNSIRTWREATCAHKIVTGYLMVSFAIGLPVQIFPLLGWHNIWLVHLWILTTTVCLGQWILIRSRVRYARRARFFWGFAVFLWFALAFTLGILAYYPYAHLYMSTLGLSGVLCSRQCSAADKALSIAFSAEILVCAIPMFWHGEIPAFWAVRNVAWIVAFLVIGRTHK